MKTCVDTCVDGAGLYLLLTLIISTAQYSP